MEQKCENCKLRAYYDRNPKSFRRKEKRVKRAVQLYEVLNYTENTGIKEFPEGQVYGNTAD